MRNLPASQHAECDGIVSSVSHWASSYEKQENAQRSIPDDTLGQMIPTTRAAKIDSVDLMPCIILILIQWQ